MDMTVSDQSPTLRANGRASIPATAFSIDPLSSNSMKSQNPHSGFHETEVIKCLDTSDGNPGKNQGGTVVVGAFMGGQGSKARSIGYSETEAPTLKAAPSGGNTVPDIVYALQGNGIGRDDKNGCNGAGWRENGMYTLNAIDQHCVAFDCRNVQGNDVSATLCAKEDGGLSLNYINHVCMPIDQHQQDARFRLCEDGIVPTMTSHMGTGGNNTPMVLESSTYPAVTGPLMANTHPGSYTGQDAFSDMLPVVPGTPPRKYIVRRLTPVECARLQGFPDWWCIGLGTEEPTEEEIGYWMDVWNTWNRANGLKDTTRNRVVKWLASPGTDGAEYKLWGNGIALPNATYVLEGVAEAIRAANEKEAR